MDFDELRDRLLSIARDRLRNIAGAFDRFEYDLKNTTQGASLVALTQLSLPAAYEVGERMGSPDAAKWIQEHLTSSIDRWAQNQSFPPAVKPRPSVKGAANKRAAKDVLKRGALITKFVRDWPTVERDLNDASENGLAKAAKVPREHGMWFVEEARMWAIRRGKLHSVEVAPVNSVFALAGKKHRA